MRNFAQILGAAVSTIPVAQPLSALSSGTGSGGSSVDEYVDYGPTPAQLQEVARARASQTVSSTGDGGGPARAFTSRARPVANSVVQLRQSNTSRNTRLLATFLPAVGGTLLGALLWRNHRVLGALSGMTIGFNTYSLIRGEREGDRVNAACALGSQALSVTGSLLWKKHPVLGYLGGSLVGVGATLAVPGSYGNKMISGR